MKRSKWILPQTVALASWLALAVGCQPSDNSVSDGAGNNAQQSSGRPDTHDHAAEPQVPTNFNEGLQLLNEQHAVIKAAFEAERPEDAHDALHDVGQVLEALPALASSNPKISSSLDSIKQSVEQLFDQFGLLDETLHGGEEVDFEDVNHQIEKALLSLKEFAQ